MSCGESAVKLKRSSEWSDARLHVKRADIKREWSGVLYGNHIYIVGG